MKLNLRVLLFCVFSILSVNGSLAFDSKPSHLFVENKGQLTDQNRNLRSDILFYGSLNERLFFLKQGGVSYELRKPIEWDSATKSPFPGFKIPNIRSVAKWSCDRIDINWIGINLNCTIETQKQSEDYDNFYLPSCPNGATYVRSYGALLYKNIYNGVDLKYYEYNGQLKYDYIIKPNFDHSVIKFQINGANKISINSLGQLVLETSNGSIIEDAPHVTQEGKTLKAKWKLKGNLVSFIVNGRDPAKEMTIDPLVRFWGTYYGGSGMDIGVDCETDTLGNVYLCGSTKSTNQIATVGSFQSTITNTFDNDAFLVKFNSSGLRQWGTYYGSFGVDYFNKIGVYKTSIIYVSGGADMNSATGLSTNGVFQPTFAGGNYDGIVARFNTSGIREWCSFYGGESDEDVRALAVGSGAELYFVGTTTSTTNLSISTLGSHQYTYAGNQDAYAVKFDSTGQRIWGTYCGGGFTEWTEECDIDRWDNLFVVGVTVSYDNIGTTGVHQPTISGGGNNAFLVKFNSSGVRQWGTYYGGNLATTGLGCATDLSGNSYMTGATDVCTVGIATPGCHQSTFAGSQENAYLVKFDPNGQRIWGTYYGASKVTVGRSIATDKYRNVYLEGHTNSSNCGDTIATLNGFQTYNNSTWPAADFFIVKFDSTGLRKMGTYYGGPIGEVDGDIEIDPAGFIYLAGASSSPTGSYIATPAAHQYSYSAGIDACLAKFFDCGSQVSADVTSKNDGCFGQSNGSVTLTAQGGGGYTYTWIPSGGNSNIATNLATGIYTCLINSYCGSTTQTVSIVQPPTAVSSTTLGSDTSICVGNSGTLVVNASGGVTPYSYSWSTSSTLNIIAVSPSVTTTYTCLVTDANNCSYLDTITLKVDQCVGLNEIDADQNTYGVYPNPNSGKFTIYGNTRRSSIQLEIVDVSGKRIKRMEFETESVSIDISSFANGLYFVKLTRDHTAIFSCKVSKEQ